MAMLPGGWLLAAGDAEGGLSCTDLRMIGGSSGKRSGHRAVGHYLPWQAISTLHDPVHWLTYDAQVRGCCGA